MQNSKAKREISKNITHFINTYCRNSTISFHDAYSKLMDLYETNREEYDRIILDQECPREAS
ncbi:MAG: hypothetical protein OEW60_08715 [Thiovulaceae bacterium]|nr:hypothetical protein [Sulfurimonadaceae bacterium]